MVTYHNTQHVGEPTVRRAQLQSYTKIAGAAVSALLIVGAGVWGYKLLLRSVSGVPVITAPIEPARVQPETPGGLQATHQGLAVNDVAADGGASGPADRVLLAPERVTLGEEDVAAAQISVDKEADALLSRQLIINSVISQVLNEGSVSDAVEDDMTQSALLPATEPGSNIVIRSQRPRVRPAVSPENLTTEEGAAANIDTLVAATIASEAQEIEVSSLAPGTRLAQLGAYDTAGDARTAWNKLYAKFGDYLAGRNYLVQTAESGGRMIYRLRTDGFQNLSDTRRFCAALSAEKAECIPVVIR